MSTTINVTVDDGGLPAKNRQQTAANRQAFVQGQASRQAAQQGADQRAADRRAAGLDPTTGRPLASAGASSRLPRIQQEPAANRFGEKTAISHQWHFTTQLVQSGFSTGLARTLPGGVLVESTIPTLRTQQQLVSSGDGSTWTTCTLGSLSPSSGPPPGSPSVPPWPGTTSKTFSTLASPSITYSYIVLPTGYGNSILTIISIYAWNKVETSGVCGETSSFDDTPILIPGLENYGGSSFSSGGETTYFSYAVNNKTIRPIGTPDILKAKLYETGPRLITVNTPVDVWPTVDFDSNGARVWFKETYPLKTIQSASVYLYSEGGAALETYNTELYSPLVYERLNQGIPYTNSIKSLPTSYKGFVADGRYGIYDKLRQNDDLTWHQLFVAGDTFDYAQWPVPAQIPSLNVWEPDYEGILPKRLPKKTLQLVATNPPGYDIQAASWFADTVLAITDWGDPIYCASRALELGFTAEDLIAEAPLP